MKNSPQTALMLRNKQKMLSVQHILFHFLLSMPYAQKYLNHLKLRAE